jgi:hypothetical protein
MAVNFAGDCHRNELTSVEGRLSGRRKYEQALLYATSIFGLNQYFSNQVVAISTFGNSSAGNLSKHWDSGRGGGDRNCIPTF